MLFRDAFIDYVSKSEQGREYLEDAYNLKQTSPNKQKLRKYFGKEE